MVLSRRRITCSRPVLLLPLLLGPALFGCGEKDQTPAPSEPQAVLGGGTDPTPSDPGGAQAADLPEQPERHLGTVSIRGTVLDARIFGEMQAGARVRVDMLYASGARPADLRIWIGTEAASADAVATPEVVDKPKLHRGVLTLGSAPQDDDRLWMEFTAPGGVTARGSLALR